MAKKRATAVRLLKDATPGDREAIASNLVRRSSPASLNSTPLIPCDLIAAVVMLFACSREEAGQIPLDDIKAEVATAVDRDRWSSRLAQYGYRIDVPTETTLPSGPSAKQLARVREAIKAAGRRATSARVLATMKGDNTEGKGMRRTVFLECLEHLATDGKYVGHKLAR